MFNIIKKSINVYKRIEMLKERLQDKLGTPHCYFMFRDVKGTESGKVYSDTFYMDKPSKEILDIIDNQNIKYQIDPNKQVYNYIFSINDKDKVKDIIYKTNKRLYDKKGHIEDIDVIDNSYLEQVLYDANRVGG